MAGRFSVEAVFKAVDRVTAPVSRMQNRIGKFMRGIGRGLRRIDRAASKLTTGIKRVGTAVLGLGGTAVAAGVLTDQLTRADVRSQQLSKAMGSNADDMQAITAAVSGAGLEFDDVIDLVEEMNNKLGESKGLEATVPVRESLQILGLEFRNLRKLAPEEQFKTIADAALQMEDAQQAAAAADVLLGGKANRLIGVLRQQGGTVDEIIARYAKLNVRTEESREGAARFQEQMRTARFAVSNIASEVAGLAGKALAPLLKRLTDWIKANKELVQTRITDFVDNLNSGLNWLIENFGSIVKWTKRIGVGLAVFASLIAVLKTLIVVMTAVNLVMALNPIGLIVLAIGALIAAIPALIFWWDEVKGAFESLPGPVQTAINVMLLPIRGLIKAARLIMDNWKPIKSFFKDLWGGVVGIFEGAVDKIMAVVNTVKGAVGAVTGFASDVGSFFGLSNEEDEGPRGLRPGPGPEVVSPQARTAQSVQEARQTNDAEVTIRDETGRAEVSQGSGKTAPVKLIDSGAF